MHVVPFRVTVQQPRTDISVTSDAKYFDDNNPAGSENLIIREGDRVPYIELDHL
jgi:hypothetical protein